MLDLRPFTFADNFESVLTSPLQSSITNIFITPADVDVLSVIVKNVIQYTGVFLTLDDGTNKEVVQCYDATAGQSYVRCYRDPFGILGTPGVGVAWPAGTAIAARLNAGQMNLCLNSRIGMTVFNPRTTDLQITYFENHRSVHAVLGANIQITITPSGKDPENVLWKKTLLLQQDAIGGRTVTWVGVVWPGGVTPTLSTAANAIDMFEFVRINGTSQWLGRIVGQNFAG